MQNLDQSGLGPVSGDDGAPSDPDEHTPSSNGSHNGTGSDRTGPSASSSDDSGTDAAPAANWADNPDSTPTPSSNTDEDGAGGGGQAAVVDEDDDNVDFHTALARRLEQLHAPARPNIGEAKYAELRSRLIFDDSDTSVNQVLDLLGALYARHHASNQACDDFLDFSRSILPDGHDMPSGRRLRARLSGLTHTSADMCRRGCVVYVDAMPKYDPQLERQFASLTKCPRCKSRRWVEINGRRVPTASFRYFMLWDIVAVLFKDHIFASNVRRTEGPTNDDIMEVATSHPQYCSNDVPRTRFGTIACLLAGRSTQPRLAQ